MRSILAIDVADVLRERIADGELRSGARLHAGDLADLLEVSRTPVREALFRLAAEGFVDSHPRRGFFVQKVGPDEAAELYGIRAILDPAALELAGLPRPDALRRLAAINTSIAESAEDVERTIDLDDRWHEELLAVCPNRVLLDLIRRFMRRTRPLERRYVRERGSVDTMVAGHARILDALWDEDLPAAVAALRGNMRAGLAAIVAWLESDWPPDDAT